eukprot:756424-Pelagomonas_calceolata.AAC.3
MAHQRGAYASKTHELAEIGTRHANICMGGCSAICLLACLYLAALVGRHSYVTLSLSFSCGSTAHAGMGTRGGPRDETKGEGSFSSM